MYKSALNRNRNFLNMIKKTVQLKLGDTFRDEIGRNPFCSRNVYYNPLNISIDYKVENPKVVVYEEGDFVVIGMDLSCVKCNVYVDDHDDGYFREARVESYLKRVIPKLDEEEIEVLSKDFEKFKKSKYYEELKSIVKVANDSKKTFSLLEKAYPKYFKRDILPLLNIDFEKMEISYVYGKWARTNLQSRQVHNISYNDEDDIILIVGNALYQTAFPFGLIAVDGLIVNGTNIKRVIT